MGRRHAAGRTPGERHPRSGRGRAADGREGQTFDGTVLGHRGDGARVQLTGPLVSVKVEGLDAAAGTTVRLRLTGADIATGEIVLVAVDGPADADGAGAGGDRG
ncbi:hypothetical protein [Microbacterium elymi]|uniref:RNase II-type exonuclease C-terminal S1 domain-containing protein n=1 Tax=Microbacterium elymi TaxID=2909587 RepID=A0ABY5NNA7_9MICO|nr:hypothetical protein [Microbacterium elymi]UUT36696.1 hypothetical protein L2X98_32745 [Microbacterium elymi]